MFSRVGNTKDKAGEMMSTKEKLIDAAQRIRDHLCAYSAGDGRSDPDLHRCDCKFGADRIGQHSEQGNGCPEMAVIEDVLDGMTARQINAAHAKGLKKRHLRIKRKRKVSR